MSGSIVRRLELRAGERGRWLISVATPEPMFFVVSWRERREPVAISPCDRAGVLLEESRPLQGELLAFLQSIGRMLQTWSVFTSAVHS